MHRSGARTLRKELPRLGRVWLEDQCGINRPPQGAAPTGSGLTWRPMGY